MTTVKQDAIFGPMFAMFFLAIFMWFYLYAKRLPFLTMYTAKHKIARSEMNDPTSRHYLGATAPPAVRNPSDNFKNLLEVPTVFYAFVMYLFVVEQVDATYVRMSWTFAALRYGHTAIHCTVNKQPFRFIVYALSTNILFFMIVRAALSHYNAS